MSFSGCACPRLAKKTQEAESCLERVLNSLESRQQPGVWRLFKWITQGSLIGESPARLNPFEYTNLNKRQTISFGTIWNIQCEIEKLSILLMWITCTISFLKYTVMFCSIGSWLLWWNEKHIPTRGWDAQNTVMTLTFIRNSAILEYDWGKWQAVRKTAKLGWQNCPHTKEYELAQAGGTGVLCPHALLQFFIVPCRCTNNQRSWFTFQVSWDLRKHVCVFEVSAYPWCGVFGIWIWKMDCFGRKRKSRQKKKCDSAHYISTQQPNPVHVVE